MFAQNDFDLDLVLVKPLPWIRVDEMRLGEIGVSSFLGLILYVAFDQTKGAWSYF